MSGHHSKRSPLYGVGIFLLTGFFLPGVKKAVEDVLAGEIKEKGIQGVLSSAGHASIEFVIDHPYLAFTIVSFSISGLVVWWFYWKFFEASQLAVFDNEKERAYLQAFQEYIDSLNLPIGYDEKEYTPLSATLFRREIVKSRFLFRASSQKDQPGLRPREILNLQSGSYIKNVLPGILRLRQPTLLLGDPGSGKSVTLRQISLDIARLGFGRRLTSRVVPIYVQLGAYTEIDTAATPVPLLDFIKHQLNNVIPNGKLIVENLDLMLLRGRVALLFDSMDEMPRADFEARAAKLKSFIIEHGTRNYIVVACREREYTGEIPHSELVILPFGQDSLKEYLKNSWALYGKEFLSPERQVFGYHELFKIALPEYDLHALSSNPYFLKLTCQYFFTHDGVLPRSQSELLGGYIEERLSREVRRGSFSDRGIESIQTTLAKLAFGLIDNGRGTFFARQDIVHAASGEHADQIVTGALASGLIVKQRDGLLRFEHHRLQEYLAASYWEEVAADHRVTVQHLRNPWWRETLVIRAGISADINRLIGQVFECLDDRYLARINLLKTDADMPAPPMVHENADIVTLLNYLSNYEVAMSCAKQKWDGMNPYVENRLLEIAEAIAVNGDVLEKARLARSLVGVPITFAANVLIRLVAEGNEWVVGEAMMALSPRDMATPEYEQVVTAFVANRAMNMRARFQALRHIPIAARLKYGKKSTALLIGSFLRAAATVAVPTAFAILVVSYFSFLDPSNVANREYVLYFTGIALLMSMGLVFSGVFLTTIVFSVYVIALIIFPSRTAWRLLMACFMYAVFLGPYFRTAEWIKPRGRKITSLFLVFPRYAQVLVAATFLQPVLILIGVHFSGGPVEPIYWFYPSLLVALLVPVFVERLCARRVEKLIEISKRATDDQNGVGTLRSLISRLGRPLPEKVHKMILMHVTDMHLKEEVIIRELHALAETNEFFLSSDEILRAIDRLDLRRKRKELETRI